MSGRSRYRRDRSRDRKGAGMKLSQNAETGKIAVDFTDDKAKVFTPEDFAIYRHVWNLGRTQSGALDRYFLLKSSVGAFLYTVDQNHAFKDMLCIGDIHYEIEYMECAYNYLVEHQEKSLIISFRRNVANHLAVAIVRIMRPGTEGAFSKTSNLV